MTARTFRRFSAAAALVWAATGCASRGGPPATAPGTAPRPELDVSTASRRSPPPSDVVDLYRRLGLLATAGETPFVGSLAFLGTRSTDSTLMVVTVSIPNRSLRFSREGDRYRSGYAVTLDVKRGSETVRTIKGSEVVRVLAFRETQRADESVLYRRFVTLAAGTYDIRLHIRGDSVSNGSAIEATVGVPRFGDGALSSPVTFYEAVPRVTRDSFPRLLPTPRSTVVFGRDSVLPVYVEGYGSAPSFPIRVNVFAEGAATPVWTDSANLTAQRDLFSGVVYVPISKVGVGVMTVGVARVGGTDTLRTPMFVAFGEDLPVATFAEMLSYLRYYVSGPRLQAMRDATPEARAALWAAFIRDTDPVPQTPNHEGLRDYFGRIAQANLRFREEGGAGWMSDRGRVFVALGSPDQILEPNVNDLSQRGRTQIWEYRQHRLALVFVDQSGFGRWRLTLSSETEFESTARRLAVQ